MTNSNCRSRAPERDCMLLKREEEKQQLKIGWRSDELSRLSWTGRPTNLHWCTDAAMPSIHIHSRWSQHHQTAGRDLEADRKLTETQGIINILLVDEAINKLSIVTYDTAPAISWENVNDLARSEKASLGWVRETKWSTERGNGFRQLRR
jgi:hypothetical protein